MSRRNTVITFLNFPLRVGSVAIITNNPSTFPRKKAAANSGRQFHYVDAIGSLLFHSSRAASCWSTALENTLKSIVVLLSSIWVG